MSGIREFVGGRFDKLKLEAEHSNFAGQWIRDMDRDELLATIGWLCDYSQLSERPKPRPVPNAESVRG
jgi:hypothetical protein